ncbi:DUF2071 domain-containing protein [bacterium]|nr:DUF2071 domain-containing protein [bacterium]
MQRPVFLTAEWRHLLMLNYVVDPAILAPYVPQGTELDLWDGQALVSIVGFQFLDTRLLGWSIPGHRNFDEVNLRFYIRRWTTEGWRRGVVFIKELAPRHAIVLVARGVYHENYEYASLTHTICEPSPDTPAGQVRYQWTYRGEQYAIQAVITASPQSLEIESLAEFITEHYWGYSRRPDGITLEYEVQHPPWKIWSADQFKFSGDVSRLYGGSFAPMLSVPPHSGLVAEGSAIQVCRGCKLPVRSEGVVTSPAVPPTV